MIDLFKKKFEYEHVLKAVNRSKAGLLIESGATLNDAQSIRGYVKGTYPVPQYGEAGFEVYTDASQSSQANFRFTGLLSGLSINTLANSRDKDRSFKGPVGAVELEYVHDSIAATVTAKSDLNVHKVDASASVGSDGISVGGAVTADVSNGAEVGEINYGAEYAQDDYVCSMFTEKNAAFVHTSYFQRITRDHVLGANFRYELKTGGRLLTVGSEYRVDPNTIIKAKVDLPTGDVAAHVEHRLQNPKLLFGVASLFNIKQTAFQAQKLGVSISLGDF